MQNEFKKQRFGKPLHAFEKQKSRLKKQSCWVSNQNPWRKRYRFGSKKRFVARKKTAKPQLTCYSLTSTIRFESLQKLEGKNCGCGVCRKMLGMAARKLKTEI